MDGVKMWIIKESINKFFLVLDFLILARVIAPWFGASPYSKGMRLLYQLTEPILAPFRNLLFRYGLGGTLDFSPIVAMLALNIVQSFILRIL